MNDQSNYKFFIQINYLINNGLNIYKIDEAAKLIKLAIENYNLFLKLIDTFTPKKKAEAIPWLKTY